MFNQNKKLLVHSGFVANAGDEGVSQAHNEAMTFNYWFWHGGFLVGISYLIIIIGTGILIRNVFSLIKEQKKCKTQKYV